TARSEVGERCDELLGRRRGPLVEMDRGHHVLLSLVMESGHRERRPEARRLIFRSWLALAHSPPELGAVEAALLSLEQPRGQARAGGACSRRQKKYESPQSTPVPAAQLHTCGPSPIAKWAMSADPRVMAKPA